MVRIVVVTNVEGREGLLHGHIRIDVLSTIYDMIVIFLNKKHGVNVSVKIDA